MTLFPSTQKGALDSTLLAFQSSNLNSSKADSMKGTAIAHDDSAQDLSLCRQSVTDRAA
jgi:hypothetical protein